MPLFHFNIADHVREWDLDGTEMSGKDEARVQAIVFAGEYLRDNPGLISEGHEFRVEVTDHAGVAIFTIRIDLIDEPTKQPS